MSVLSRYQTDAIYPYGFGEDGELAETHKIYKFNPLQSSNAVVSAYGAPQRRWTQENNRQRRPGFPFIEVYRKAENAEQLLVRYNEGGGRWIGNEAEDVGVDKIYLDSAIIVELCKELYKLILNSLVHKHVSSQEFENGDIDKIFRFN